MKKKHHKNSRIQDLLLYDIVKLTYNAELLDDYFRRLNGVNI